MSISCIEVLETLCRNTYNNGNGDYDDLRVAKSAVELLVSASKGGCCFLEEYIVMLVNYLITAASLEPDDNEPMKIKCNKLLKRVLTVEFDRIQMTENLRRPHYRFVSIDHLIQLLLRVEDLLDYREPLAVDWLSALIDAYHIELTNSLEASDIIDRISAQIDSRCALLKQVVSTKHLLVSVLGLLDNETASINNKTSKERRKVTSDHIRITPKYSIEQIEL